MKNTLEHSGIPVEIEYPNMIRLKLAIKMRRQGKHPAFIAEKLNELIAEQNELRKELGWVPVPLVDQKKVIDALEYADKKGITSD